MSADLTSLAMDLAWSWDGRIRALFEGLDPQGWRESGGNPVLLLRRLGDGGVAAALERPAVRALLDRARLASAEHRDRPRMVQDPSRPLAIGYFSLEFGLTDVLPIYSGGLGVLAGDHLKAAGDLGAPVVGVGLLYRQGFGRQRIDARGGQAELFVDVDFDSLPIERVRDAGGDPLEITCPIRDREVRAAVWRVRVGQVSLYLLDTDIESNPPELRSITDRLYVPEPERRLPQEMVLGIGGMRALRAMGIDVTVVHMNEGHAFLTAVERLREIRESRLSPAEARALARAGLVFTTHTPIAAGSDYFDPALVYELLGPYLGEVGLSFERFMDLGRSSPGDESEPLCTTLVGLRLAEAAVGVSRLHGAVSRRLWRNAWPDLPVEKVPIGSVTNGVHMPSWIAPQIGALLDRYVDRGWWDLEPDDGRWGGIDLIPGTELWACHSRLRLRLVEHARTQVGGSGLDPDRLTIGFSRRFAPYKRADLLLRDPGRLNALLARTDRPVQLIFAGKAHPADAAGKAILRQVVALARDQDRVAFVEDYDLRVAALMVQGADVWLNNPRRFLEASGTSGMKAAANGVLNLSILDGWWDEGYRPEAGWAIPSAATEAEPEADDAAEAAALFDLLEGDVPGLFYERDGAGLPVGWVAAMRASIRLAATGFSARRMVLDYLGDCYVPAARRVGQLRRRPAWED